MLMYACERGCTLVVELLIKANAHVNAQDAWGYTPLIYASKQGHAHIVKMLLDAGADHTIYSEGNDALSWASDRGHTNVVGVLTDAGADNLRDFTLLLLVANAGINVTNMYGRTALSGAKQKNRYKIVNMLEKAMGATE